MAPYGILNLNKPAAVTSRDVVNQIQRLVRPAKVGHAGTLDPLATGVLVVCVGAATRLIEHVQRMPKGYTGTFLLGRSSPTEDVEGEVTELDHPPVPTREQIVAAAAALVGQIEQRPPIYSALKVNGQRAYALARKGKEVELKPRPVTIHRLAVEAYDYPQLTLNIECGSGTYVRSLGRDLAESVGTAAVMSALVRTKVGCFDLKESLEPLQVTQENWPDQLLPASQAVGALPRIELSPDEITEIRNGRSIPRSDADIGQTDAKEFAAMDTDGRLIAILIRRGEGMLGPLRNLSI